MPKEQTIIGLDIGTSHIRTLVAKIRKDQVKPQIIGIGQAPSFGLRRGLVIDVEETSKNIIQSVRQAEQTSGCPIERVYVSLGDHHMTCQPSKGVVAVSRADGEISEEDVERVINAASNISLPPNREILLVVPRCFTVDEQVGIKEPVGMNGIRLEVDTLIIEGMTPFIRNLIKCVNEAGLQVESLVSAPLAAARAVLNKRQKELGVLALDLGGGTAGLTVFEEGDMIYGHILPIGASHITNDIAIGLRTNIDLAEQIKLEYGSALASEISKKDHIDLSKLGQEEGIVSRFEVAEIIEARITEIFTLVNRILKKIDRQGLLPAGVVLLGDGAKMPGLVDLAKRELKLPAQIGFPLEIGGLVNQVDDPAFATAVGLIFWGKDIQERGRGRELPLPGLSSVGGAINKIKKWFRGFLP